MPKTPWLKPVLLRSSLKVPVLFTDIDNTFYRADQTTATQQLWRWLCQRHIPVVAVTGADFKHVRQEQALKHLPRFAAIGSSLGGALHILQANGRYHLHAPYQTFLKTKPFVPTIITNTLKPLCKQYRITAQPKSVTPLKKISYHVLASVGEQRQLDQQLQQRLKKSYYITWSEEIYYNQTLAKTARLRKYNLDITAQDKASVVEWLTQRFQIQDGWVAGESGNDISLFERTGYPAIIVGGQDTIMQRWPRGSSVIYDEINPKTLGPTSLLLALQLSFQRATVSP